MHNVNSLHYFNMKHKIIFSIIIPTYNREHMVIKTIQYALRQNFSDYEVIVVDDGSTDGTGKLVGQLNDERLHYVWKANAERGAARNFGTLIANGQYVNFLDSDDLLFENHLSEAHRLIAKYYEPEIFHLNYVRQDESGRKIDHWNNLSGNLNRLLFNGNALSCNGVFIRRDIALQFPFSEIRQLSASEDWLLWLRLCARFKFYSSSVVTSAMIIHDERSILTSDEERMLNRKKLLIQQLQMDEVFMRHHGSKLPRIEARILSYIALHLVLLKENTRSLIYLMKSFRINPSELIEIRTLAIIKHLMLNLIFRRKK